MTKEQCVAFLSALRVKNITVKENKVVNGSCPLARWKHSSKKDSLPSFGLFIKDGENSYYHCFTCGSGSAQELIGAMELYLPKDEKPYYDFATARILLDQELFVLPLPEYEEFPQTVKPFQPWPEWWLDTYYLIQDSVEGQQYLASRENPTSLQVAVEHGLRYDKHRKMIVHPYRNVYGLLAGARGRGITPGATGMDKHYDYTLGTMNNSSLVWYNEPALNYDGWVAVVEGQYDCMRTAIAWPKTVAGLTALPTREKFKKLTESDGMVHITDNDETGNASSLKFRELCREFKLRYRRFVLPPEVKDPDLCHPDFLADGIEQAISS